MDRPLCVLLISIAYRRAAFKAVKQAIGFSDGDLGGSNPDILQGAHPVVQFWRNPKRTEMVLVKYPHLFSPIKLGNVTFRNRIFASPTGSPMVIPPEYLKRECTAFYERRAQGGAAVVALGDGIVHTPTGLMHPYKLRLDDPDIIPSLSNTARAIRQHGAVASLELSHGGKYANVANLCSKNTRTGMPPYGPDHEFTADGTEILEMPEEIIETIIKAYGDAAALGKMCGFGMVIVHGGHG